MLKREEILSPPYNGIIHNETILDCSIRGFETRFANCVIDRLRIYREEHIIYFHKCSIFSLLCQPRNHIHFSNCNVDLRNLTNKNATKILLSCYYIARYENQDSKDDWIHTYLMRWDKDHHPTPDAFDVWFRDTGRCPYLSPEGWAAPRLSQGYRTLWEPGRALSSRKTLFLYLLAGGNYPTI